MHGHARVAAQRRLHFLERRVVVELEVEPERVHVLRVDLDRGREEVQLLAEGLEEVVGVAGVMRAELGIIVLARLRRGDELLRVGDVVRAAHADELAGVERDLRRLSCRAS